MNSNANFTPLGPNRRWTAATTKSESNDPQNDAEPSTVPSSIIPMQRTNMIGREIGIQGEVLARAPHVTGACRRCGFVGHLPFQCRNFIQLKPNQKTDIDISSTSSEEYTTPLTSKEDKKALKKMKKARKRELKKLKKKLKKSSRKRRHSSGSNSSDDSRERRKRKKKSKRKNKRRDSSSSLSDK